MGDQPVTLKRAYMKSSPVGPWNVTADVQRDANTAETYNFDQGTSGFILDTSILDVDSLNDGIAQIVTQNLVGEATAVRLTFKQGGLGQDADLHEFGIDWGKSAKTSEIR